MSETKLCGATRKTNGRPCRQPVEILPCQYHQQEQFQAVLASIRSGDLALVWKTALPANVSPFTYAAMAEAQS